MKRLFGIGLGVALAAMALFLLVPLVAVFVRISPDELFAQLGNSVAVDALIVSLKTNAIALAIILALGTPASYLLASRRFRGRSLLLTLIELPLVLPPAVAGLALLAAFAPQGPLGRALDPAGVSIPLTQPAVVLAVVFVASPFYLRQAVAAFEALDPSLADASRTLGASPARTFVRISIPLAAGGLGAGATLALARGLGEFGATLMFAGSLQGRTQTLPVMIFTELGRDFEVALAVGALLVLVSLAVLLIAKLIPSWSDFTSISRTRSGASVST